LSGADLMERIYREVLNIKERLEVVERLLVPEVEVSDGELEELRALRAEALRGEAVSWMEVKKKVEELIT